MKARELGPKKPSSSGNRLQAPKGGPQTCPKTLLSTQGPRVPESPPKAQQPSGLQLAGKGTFQGSGRAQTPSCRILRDRSPRPRQSKPRGRDQGAEGHQDGNPVQEWTPAGARKTRSRASCYGKPS